MNERWLVHRDHRQVLRFPNVFLRHGFFFHIQCPGVIGGRTWGFTILQRPIRGSLDSMAPFIRAFLSRGPFP